MNTEQLWISRDRRQSFARLGNAAICATNAEPMTDETCREMAAALAEANQIKPLTCGLQYSPTQSPNANQRQIFSEVFKRDHIFSWKMAIVSESMFVRGAITAMRWLIQSGVETRAYAPREVREALAWLAPFAEFEVPLAEQKLREVLSAIGMSLPHDKKPAASGR